MAIRETEKLFQQAVCAPLRQGRPSGVLSDIERHWPPARLVQLLQSATPAVAQTAAVCLGMTGSMEHSADVVSLLGHPDQQVSAAAEAALWSIWMRAGSEWTNAELHAAMRRLDADDPDTAICLLELLSQEAPDFAEAHHQRAVALHTLGRFDEAAAAYREAVQHNPHHFAALAALGHICVERDDLVGALRYYRHALQIHPRLDGICDIVPELAAAVGRRDVA